MSKLPLFRDAECAAELERLRQPQQAIENDLPVGQPAGVTFR